MFSMSAGDLFAQGSDHRTLPSFSQVYSCVCFYLLYVLLKMFYAKKVKSDTSERLPGPRDLPLIGSIGQFFSRTEPLSVSALNQLLALSKEYRKEGFFSVSLGLDQRFLVVFKPEIVERFVSTYHHLPRGDLYRFHHHFLGNSLFRKTETDFKRMRKMWLPFFNVKRIEALYPIVNRNARIMCRRLEETPESVEIMHLSDALTFDTIVETVTGQRLNCLQSNETHTFITACEGYSYLYPQRLVQPWFWSDFIYKRSSQGMQIKQHIDVMHKFTSEMIEKRKDFYLNNNKAEGKEEEGKGSKTLVDLMLDYHLRDKLISKLEMKNEINLAFFAGYETTATTGRHSLYCLGLYPDVQRQVVEELETIFGQDCERDVTAEDVKRMPLLEGVIKETLRLYPATPIITRELTHDEVIGGHVIPKGTSAVVFFYGMGRNEDAFPAAETFDPTRWSPERSKGRHPYAFGGFSSGTHNCIGQKSAMVQLKIYLSTILRRFEIKALEPVENITIEGGMTLRIPFKVSFHPRQVRGRKLA